ncbi:hypothetical protein [Lysinibacillus fusiformis]|nr:hypothetical protein [Lysinibacillus fusiformis]
MVILNLLKWDEKEYVSEAITIHPLAEGAGKLVITGFSDDSEDFLKIFF